MFPPGTATKYVELVHRYRFAILAFWLVLDVLGLIYGQRFFDATTTEFVAPPGSDAVKAENHLIKYFPAEEQVRTAVVYIEAQNGLSVFEGDLADTLYDFSRELCDSMEGSKVFVSCTSYYSFMDQGLPLLAKSFRSNVTDLATYMSLRYDGSERDDARTFIDRLSKQVRSIKKGFELDRATRMRETGVDYFQKDTLESTAEDMETMDTSTVLSPRLALLH